jgi:formylglycine-generating enzyme required for sulfatase activity
MVVLPQGEFMMGSRPDEVGHTSYEEPRHRVRFDTGFALSSTEITVGQFNAFVEATGYVTEAEQIGYASVYNERSGRLSRRRGVSWRDGYAGSGTSDREPVVHVSWNDATAYANWLAQETGQLYRLPTEAEFEYAQRAGSESSYWWGEGPPDLVVENMTGDGDRSPHRGTWDVAFPNYDDGYWGPAPVGTFSPNEFLLFDMTGNVQEWVQDCWHDSYVRAPADGSAWVNRGCERRVVRGGFWGGEPKIARSAHRTGLRADQRGSSLGFRVARDLLPRPASVAMAES